MNSVNVTAEQIWNVTAEAGYKTLVWHWPVAWPPTSKNTNLHVVDGTQPAMVNMGVAQREDELLCIADENTQVVKFMKKAASDSNIACVITGLELQTTNQRDMIGDLGRSADNMIDGQMSDNYIMNLVLDSKTEGIGTLSTNPFNIVVSSIKAAGDNWAYVPEGAKNFTLLLSEGL